MKLMYCLWNIPVIEMAHKITPVEGSLGELLNKMCINQLLTGFIRVDGVILRENYKQIADAIENIEVHDDDVWVCSFPKSGENSRIRRYFDIIIDSFSTVVFKLHL